MDLFSTPEPKLGSPIPLRTALSGRGRRELVPSPGVQRCEDARNLTSLRARRRSPGVLEQPPGNRRRITSVVSLCLTIRAFPASQKILWRCVMSLEPQKASEEIPEESLGSLRGCLVDGDAAQRRRRRSIRRRSLAISVAMQSAILTALILVSLFGKPQSIALANVTPVPSYSPYRDPSQHSGVPHNPSGPRPVCHVCVPTRISPTIPSRDATPAVNSAEAPN